jgi:hypothetical protein
MRARAVIVAATIVASAVWPAGEASAGGWDSLEFRRDHYLVGEVASTTERFYAGALEGAGPIDGRTYYAYLLPQSVAEDGFGMIDAPTIPEGSIRLGVLGISGPVYVARYDGLYGRASLTFTVPDVPTGDYAIGFCDDPCEHGYVGWLSFARIRIVHTEQEAVLLAELDRQELEGWKVRYDLRKTEREVKGMHAELHQARSDLRLERASAVTPSERIVAVPTAAGRGSAGSWGWVLAGLVAGLAVGLLLGRRGRGRPPEAAVPDTVPEDLERLESVP